MYAAAFTTSFQLYMSRFTRKPTLRAVRAGYSGPTHSDSGVYSVCIPRDFYVTNATVDRNILLRFRSENKGYFFISSSFLMKHGAVYAAYRSLSPGFQRSLISGLVSSNFDEPFLKIY